MLFASGGSSANSASSLFRQLKPALDKDQNGSVSRDELLAGKQSVQSGGSSNGADTAIDFLLTNYDSYINPENGDPGLTEENVSEEGLSEEGIDAAEELKEEQEAQEAEEKEEEEAQAQKDEQERVEREKVEQAKAEQNKTVARSQDKEQINNESRATSLFKLAFKQLTGEDASAEDVNKWEKAVKQPTTNLDKARQDVLSVRPELKDQLSTGVDPKVMDARKDAVSAALSPFSLGSVAKDQLARDYASRGGSVQSVVTEALNEYA